jgi:hypothetical protein
VRGYRGFTIRVGCADSSVFSVSVAFRCDRAVDVPNIRILREFRPPALSHRHPRSWHCPRPRRGLVAGLTRRVYAAAAVACACVVIACIVLYISKGAKVSKGAKGCHLALFEIPLEKPEGCQRVPRSPRHTLRYLNYTNIYILGMVGIPPQPERFMLPTRLTEGIDPSPYSLDRFLRGCTPRRIRPPAVTRFSYRSLTHSRSAGRGASGRA